MVLVDGKWVTPGHVCIRDRATQKAARIIPGLIPAVHSKRPSPALSWPFAPVAVLQRRTLRLWLPRAVSSREGPNGRVWQAKARAAKEWRDLVADAVVTLEEPPRWTRAAVRYELFTRGREIDPDNRVALGKPILDGIVAAGVLPDDRGANVVGPTAQWAPSPLPWGFVRVTLTRETARCSLAAPP